MVREVQSPSKSHGSGATTPNDELLPDDSTFFLPKADFHLLKGWFITPSDQQIAFPPELAAAWGLCATEVNDIDSAFRDCEQSVLSEVGSKIKTIPSDSDHQRFDIAAFPEAGEDARQQLKTTLLKTLGEPQFSYYWMNVQHILKVNRWMHGFGMRRRLVDFQWNDANNQYELMEVQVIDN